ncbi:MAG TPA: tRNA uridine-5-carboxymethylaminomethyl(34) synthesis enzyme MnmG [Candidatus Angelobacter sp.]|jgi:tRNA uridine 5-carboxymethylaminomethyl modification enzyme|nr:tRNA uridine-5-carboxymethylaminomethyl(34) synthesis enzyme MnmG [Candidatus Angelobacter sp.]
MTYDVVVVGGGHAGAEAAAAAALMGSRVLLISMNIQTIGQMSCNPAVGGIAKGQIVREIDALGGQLGIVTDSTMIQFRMLNRSKGPAVWSPRAQSDRKRFTETWRRIIERIPTLDLFQDMVVYLLLKRERVIGVKTLLGFEIQAKSVVLTTGTFLNGIIHIGKKKINGGRLSESSSINITEQLKKLGFFSGRMKTGTSPRIDGRSLDFSKMNPQLGDDPPGKFSYLETPRLKNQRCCYITHTNTEVHKILQSNFNQSPIFNGTIKSLGPRYCPSIEDKVYRFSNKEHHQIFVEPEGWDTNEVYINGFSTSLPDRVQYMALKKITGFESVKILKLGYAIEYDYFPPTQLKPTLETKKIKNLFHAGQINGTTGYEEAAAQGVLAGINAHLKTHKKDSFVLKRNEAYIGVLIDDLISKGTEEPYRMFTARAEHRILLRQDNADERLTHLSYRIGLADSQRMRLVGKKVNKLEKSFNFLQNLNITKKFANLILSKKNSPNINHSLTLNASKFLSRPEINIQDILFIPDLEKFVKKKIFEERILEQTLILIKYKVYIEREKKNAEKLSRLENIKIPEHFNYQKIKSLSSEAREKLMKYRPDSMGQVSRISGISPVDINILLIHLTF